MEGWMQVVGGVGVAFLVLLLIVVIVICVKLFIIRKQNKLRAQFKTDVTMTNPFARPGSRDVIRSTAQTTPSSDPIYRWWGNNNQTPPPNPMCTITKSEECKGSLDSLYSSNEMLDSSGDTTSPSRKISLFPPDALGLSRAESLREVPAEFEDSVQHLAARIDFHIMYESSSSTLRCRVVKVSNLPFKYHKRCSSFVKVSLLARRKSTATTQVIHKSLNPAYEECFSFPGYSLMELKQYTLRFTVYVKRHLQVKNKLIGDVYYPISKRQLNPDDEELVCTEHIAPPAKKNSTSKTPAASVGEGRLGQLFILLQYQASANRMKVLVRKAENLPKTGRTLSKPDYYVLINLVRNDEIVTSSETRASAGYNPVWNQPFLFDVPADDTDSYSLQFVMMRGKFYTSDGIVGHVPLGSNIKGGTGVGHWHEAMQPRAKEVAKWHNLQPF